MGTFSFARELTGEITYLAEKIEGCIKIMEVCGTHTVSLRRAGIHSILPNTIKLISGPGCPVCVTPSSYIDNAIELIRKEDAVIATFGDMLKVRSTRGESLADFTGTGKVKIIYSPMQVLELAREIPGPVVVLGIGFETTIPALIFPFSLEEAQKLDNLFLYTAFKTVPQALTALLEDRTNRIDGFLLPGHVSALIGHKAYSFLAPYSVPAVITGFEPEDMLYGILLILKQLYLNEPKVENGYKRVVTDEGNKKALDLIKTMLDPEDAVWRGFGTVPASGLALNKAYRSFDAARCFSLPPLEITDPPDCLCAGIIQGKNIPPDCPFFASRCTPENPVGPCMVSSEGCCAAYFKYPIIT